MFILVVDSKVYCLISRTLDAATEAKGTVLFIFIPCRILSTESRKLWC